MRKVNKTIEIIEYTSVTKLITSEEISNYSVDLKNKTISVNIDLSDDDKNVLKSESYKFTGDSYVTEVSEDQLWQLIDESRN